MSQESPVISEYYSLVDSPQQYYVIVQALDTMDFIFHLYKTKRIDKELWLRSEATCKAVMTIPKFKRVWDKIKAAHMNLENLLIQFYYQIVKRITKI